MRFKLYLNWLDDVGLLLDRKIKPSPLAVELFELEASPEDAALEYGDQL